MTSPEELDVGAPTATGTAETVIDELLRRGFRLADDGDHAVLERHELRVVVPGRDRLVPPRVVRMIECALEPHLGLKWLTAPHQDAQPRRARYRAKVGSRTVYALRAIVIERGPSEPWCACLIDDFSVIGFGSERDDALRDLERATACWMHVDVEDVVLVTSAPV